MALFTRRFEAYLRSHPFAHQFWKLGHYLLPAYIVMDDGRGNVSTNRSLVGEFYKAMHYINQSQLVLAQMNMKCQLVTSHPLYWLIIDNNSVVCY